MIFYLQSRSELSKEKGTDNTSTRIDLNYKNTLTRMELTQGTISARSKLTSGNMSAKT